MKTTIEDHCNESDCKFFYTKDGTIPDEFLALHQAAMILLERDKKGLEKREDSFPFWAIEGYKVDGRAFDRAEADYNESRNKPEGEENDALGMDKPGDTDVFAQIEREWKNPSR